MKLPKELTTVTKTSKILAAIVFITLPFLGFYLGMNYQQTLNSASKTTTNEPIIKHAPLPSEVSTKEGQPLDVSTWKTYTNSQYNFSVSYPKDFFINESSTKEYDTFDITISDAQKLSQFSNNNISISIIVTNKSYKGYKNNYNSCCAYGWITTVFNSMINSPIGTQYKEMTKVKNATIGGVKGIIFEVNQAHVDETMSIPSLYAAFIKDEKALLINGITGDRKLIFQDPYKHIFNQILQTFQFTN